MGLVLGTFQITALNQVGSVIPQATGDLNFGVTYGSAAEICQNIRMILTTPLASVPYMRSFGLDYSFLDQPILRAKAMLGMEVFKKIAKWEPRALLSRIDFYGDGMTGYLNPSVVITLNTNKSQTTASRTVLPTGTLKTVIDVSSGSAVVTQMTVSS